MFQLLEVEATKAQKSFDTTVISRVQKVGAIVQLETRIYAVWSLNIARGNILYNSAVFRQPEQPLERVSIPADYSFIHLSKN